MDRPRTFVAESVGVERDGIMTPSKLGHKTFLHLLDSFKDVL
jgi:hypothetical protein